MFVDYNDSNSILSANIDLYSALFIDYVINDNDDFLRAGTIKAVWNAGGSINKWTEETTDSIGDTSLYTFSLKLDSGTGVMNVLLTNDTSTKRVYCSYTSRLLFRPNIF